MALCGHRKDSTG